MKYLAIFAILIASTLVQAQEQQKESDRYSYTASTMLLSKYYGSIVGGIFYDKPLTFNSLTISRSDKNGSTYGVLWAARPVTNLQWNRDGGDEYDIVIGRTFDIGKNTSGKPALALNISGTYLAVHPLTARNAHVVTGMTRVDLPRTKFIQPYGVVYYFGKTGQNSPPAG